MAKKNDRGRPAGRKISQATIYVRVPQEIKDLIEKYRQQQQIPPRESDVIRDLLTRGLKDVGLL